MKVVYVGGCGRLGLPLAAVSADCGHEVFCADINQEMVDRVNAGDVDTMEPGVTDLVAEYGGKELQATTDIAEACSWGELINVIVPTPSKRGGSFSNAFILDACERIGLGMCKNSEYQVVNIVSTVMPGSVNGEIATALSAWAAGVLGEEWGITYSPEFVAQGRIVRDFRHPDMVMIGADTERASDVVARYYRSIVDVEDNFVPFRFMSVASAEVAKIALNVSVVTKIQLANQVAMICHNTPGANAGDVLGAIGDDSRIGHRYFSPGVWPGGPCFPRDCRALSAHAGITDTPAVLIGGVEAFTNVMAHWLAAQVWHYGSRIGILGLTYKPGVDIMEESPGIKLGEMLPSAAVVWYHDPTSDRVPSLDEVVDMCDVLVLMTPWEAYHALEEMDLSGKTVIDMWGFLDSNKIPALIRFGG